MTAGRQNWFEGRRLFALLTLTLAGATILPASPSFYGNPKSIEDLVDTVIARVYDLVGIEAEVSTRWKALQNEPRRHEDTKK